MNTFEFPVCEIIDLKESDVIVTSGCLGETSDDDL